MIAMYSKSAVIMPRATTKLHALAFSELANDRSKTPTMRARFIILSKRYDNLSKALANAKTDDILVIDNPEGEGVDLEIIRDTVYPIDWSEYPRVKTIWKVSITKKPEQDPYLSFENGSLWDLSQEIKDRKLNMPRGVLTWATYAHTGDEAYFYDKKTNLIYHITLRRERKTQND